MPDYNNTPLTGYPSIDKPWLKYKDMLPYSPTTLKKDNNKMARQTEGFIQEKDGRIVGVEMK